MKGKINLKTIIIFSILIVVIILSVVGVNLAKTFISGATSSYEPQDLNAVSKDDGKSATVTWTTDKSVKASVFYGTNMASLLLMAEDVDATVNHNILLTNLKTNTTYYYKIVADDNNVFDNGGLMYSFKTSGTDDSSAGDSSLTPTIDPTLISPSPTISASSSSATNSSTCNQTTDYNGDGTINSLDYMSCLKGKVTVTPSNDNCTGDYNKDGVINSLDRIKCLQDNKK
jgi:hypothetical protein